MVSLFTAIPVKKTCDYIQNKLDCDESVHLRTNLDTTDIISLLNFVLSNNYFVYNDSVYKQIHGCAMGSPVSPVVANLCMEAILKERVLQALQDASKTTQDVIALQSDDVTRRAEAEKWLDSLRGEVDDIVDSRLY